MKPTKPFPFVYPDKDRQGRLRWRYRPRGGKAVTIKGTLGTPEFAAAYRAVTEGAEPTPKKGVGNVRPGSFRALALSYDKCATFTGHRPETQRSQRGIINALVKKHGDKPWALIQRKHVQAMVDEKAATPSAARNLLFVMRALGQHAIDIEWRKEGDNPAIGVKRPKITTPGFGTWTENNIALYRECWRLGTMERLAIEIGLNHGPRRGDAVLHGPRQEIDDGLAYVQNKTGAEMFNTIWPPLRSALDAMPVRGLDTYLVTSFGKPFTPAGFGNWFRAACDAVPGLPKGLSFHGLRKAVCRRVAEAKGDARSNRHVQAVSGHTTSKMVDVYTAAADKKRLQREADRPSTRPSRNSREHRTYPRRGKCYPRTPQTIARKGK